MTWLAAASAALVACGSVLAAEGWEPIECPPFDERPLETMFVPVSEGDPCDDPAGWQVYQGDQNARATLASAPGREGPGSKALRIDWDFVGKQGLEYVAVAPSLKLDEPRTYIGLWAWLDGDCGPLRFRIRDKTGEVHQGDFGFAPQKQWRFLVGQIQDSGGAWGGDGNKKLDYPCVLDSIILDRPKQGFRGKGTLLIDDLAFLEKRQTPTGLISVSIADGHFGNVFRPGEDARFLIQRATGAPEGAIEVKYRLRDCWDRSLQEGSFEPGTAGHELVLRPRARGYFKCLLDVSLNGETAEVLEARFAVLDEPVPLRDVDESPFAMQSHYQSRAWSLDSLPLLARAGMKYLRDEMSWGSVEREKGVFEFSPRYDEYVDKARAAGIEPLIILDYSNPHYDDGNFPTSDEAIAGFARYCAQVATRYRGRVRYFEVWNEWTGGCGMSGKTGNTPENYVRMLGPAYAAVKEANPEAYVVGVGGEHSAWGYGMIERMFEAGALKSMDAVSVHPYRYPGTPEATDLTGELTRVVELIRKHGGSQPIWITEIGWPTQIGGSGSTEQHQARMIVRTYVQALSTGAVDRVFWYDFKDDGLDRMYNEANFGIIRNERFHCAPKPAYAAYAVMSKQLTGRKYASAVDLGAGVLACRFESPDGSAIVVAWAPDGKRAVTLPWKGAAVVDMMGNPLQPDALELSEDPVYIRVP